MAQPTQASASVSVSAVPFTFVILVVFARLPFVRLSASFAHLLPRQSHKLYSYYLQSFLAIVHQDLLATALPVIEFYLRKMISNVAVAAHLRERAEKLLDYWNYGSLFIVVVII